MDDGDDDGSGSVASSSVSVSAADLSRLLSAMQQRGSCGARGAGAASDGDDCDNLPDGWRVDVSRRLGRPFYTHITSRDVTWKRPCLWTLPENAPPRPPSAYEMLSSGARMAVELSAQLALRSLVGTLPTEDQTILEVGSASCADGGDAAARADRLRRMFLWGCVDPRNLFVQDDVSSRAAETVALAVPEVTDPPANTRDPRKLRDEAGIDLLCTPPMALGATELWGSAHNRRLFLRDMSRALRSRPKSLWMMLELDDDAVLEDRLGGGTSSDGEGALSIRCCDKSGGCGDAVPWMWWASERPSEQSVVFHRGDSTSTVSRPQHRITTVELAACLSDVGLRLRTASQWSLMTIAKAALCGRLPLLGGSCRTPAQTEWLQSALRTLKGCMRDGEAVRALRLVRLRVAVAGA